MRVIKTSVKRKAVKAAAALAVCVSAPAAALLCVRLLPEAAYYMREAAEYTGMTMLFGESAEPNNGTMLLYSEPEEEALPPAPDETEAGADVSEPVPETAEAQPSPAAVLLSEPEETAEPLPKAREGVKLTLNMSEESEDLTVYGEKSGSIAEETFGSCAGEAFIDLERGGQLRNCTDIPAGEIKTEASLPSGIVMSSPYSEPQVLIMHTHTTESYEPFEKDSYDKRYQSRSNDPKNGVAAVGEAIAEELAANGIGVIHDCTIHDAVYTGAYARSAATVRELLSRYPTIKVVLDIHRDAIEYSDGTRVSAVAEIDGKKAAQIMMICAADDGTCGVPDFMENMRFAAELEQETETLYPGLTRPILFQYCQYNQQLSHGSLLIEVGSHGNTVEQAVYSGRLIGRSLASLLKKKTPEYIPVSAGVPLYFIERLG